MRILAVAILVVLGNANLAFGQGGISVTIAPQGGGGDQDGGNMTMDDVTEAPLSTEAPLISTEAPVLTEAPSDGGMILVEETDAPSDMAEPEAGDAEAAATMASSSVTEETTAPTEQMTMTQSTTDGAAADAETDMEVDSMTVAPTDAQTMAETMAATMAVSVDADMGANGTETDTVAEVPVGDVPVETDETSAPTMAPITAAPTFGPSMAATTMAPTVAPTLRATTTAPTTAPTKATMAPTKGAVETQAPTQGATVAATPATTQAATTAPPAPEAAAATATGSPTTTGGGVEVTDATVFEPSGEVNPNECAVTLSNTDPVCGQLLKFTTVICDCYNFCSGKLIACLEFGEQNSFSCAGETVAGCTSDQRLASSARQGRGSALSSLWLAAVAATVAAAIPSSFV